MEIPLPEQLTSADLAASSRALGDLRTLCPSLSNQPLAALAAWTGQVVSGPEGESAWHWSEPTVDPDAATCLNAVLARFRVAPTQTASAVSLRLACATERCDLVGSVEQTAEIVE